MIATTVDGSECFPGSMDSSMEIFMDDFKAQRRNQKNVKAKRPCTYQDESHSSEHALNGKEESDSSAHSVSEHSFKKEVGCTSVTETTIKEVDTHTTSGGRTFTTTSTKTVVTSTYPDGQVKTFTTTKDDE